MQKTGLFSMADIAVFFTGGLALFLYGIRIMSSGLKKASGERIRQFIAKITGNRFYGLLAGAFATLIVQSSSTIIATLVGLVQSRLMSYSQALAVVLGAEIGTTAMAQLFAFSLQDYALIFFAAGFALSLAGKSESLRFTGEALSGFGLLFFGLKLMAEAMTPLQQQPAFISLLHYIEHPLLAVATGIAVTALMHSSSAFIGIIITLALQGSMSLETGIALLLGANIGTCITGVFASAGMQRAAKRVALAQVLFNVSGVLIFLPFIPQFSELIRLISFSADNSGHESLALTVPRQIANAHTFFNLFMALFFLPFLPLFDKLLCRIIPDDPEEERLIPAVKYLKDSALSTPVLALSYAKAEVARMGTIAGKMVRASLHPFINGEAGHDVVFQHLSVIKGLKMREEKLDFLEHRLSDYLIKISLSELNEQESREVFALMNIVKDLESMGDELNTLRKKHVEKKRALKSDLSEEGKSELTEIHNLVCMEIEKLALVLQHMDPQKVRNIIDDERFKQLVQKAETAHLKRVFSVPEAEITHDIHMELINILEQVHHYCKSIARTIPGEAMPVE
jgi:phosphate:Na+ symporter